MKTIQERMKNLENTALGTMAEHLAKAYDLGWQRRDAEIIKLLEGLDCENNADPLHDRHDCLAYFTADRLIALIKGKAE